MRELLSPETKARVVQLFIDNTPDYEVNRYFLSVYKNIYGCTYRDPGAVTVLRLLYDKMIESRTELMRRGKYSQDQIEYFEAQIPMTLDAIVRLFDTANLTNDEPPHLVFPGATFTQDHQFFLAKSALVELKRKLMALTPQERNYLYERCCDNEQELGQTDNARSAFNFLQTIKMQVFDLGMNNEGLGPESRVEWLNAFVFPED
jgi:hypothetical protein